MASNPRSSPRQLASEFQHSPNAGMSNSGPARLSVIDENNLAVPPRNPNRPRWSTSTAGTRASRPPRHSAEQMPPPYASFDIQRPTESKGNSKDTFRRRGGWGRLLIILLVVFIVLAIALGVGLGVGLTRHHTSNAGQEPTPTASTVFPMGQYSFITALEETQTNCTANAATWRCYPYVRYATSPTGSVATLNWLLSNTSAFYPTNDSTTTTSSSGIAANVTVSSTQNPFGITVNSQSVTYINDGDGNSPRYAFNFTQSKSVVPSTAITDDNSQTLCFFNQTMFSAVMWLSNSTNHQPSLDAPSGSGGYTPWPFAIEVTQIATGGQNVPACYETEFGAIGQQITTGLNPQSSSDQCTCLYRNFDLS
ncbi:hypothetical protein MBLNU457_g0221t1 [Dothideomycetes sp. NU457]